MSFVKSSALCLCSLLLDIGEKRCGPSRCVSVCLSHFEVDNQIEWTQTYLHHNNDNTNDEEWNDYEQQQIKQGKEIKTIQKQKWWK